MYQDAAYWKIYLGNTEEEDTSNTSYPRRTYTTCTPLVEAEHCRSRLVVGQSCRAKSEGGWVSRTFLATYGWDILPKCYSI